jgi:D-mannonate dehydratase
MGTRNVLPCMIRMTKKTVSGLRNIESGESWSVQELAQLRQLKVAALELQLACVEIESLQIEAELKRRGQQS